MRHVARRDRSLVDKSLLRRQGERLRMLETIRAFAIEKLEASVFAEDIGDRHAAYFEELCRKPLPASKDERLHRPVENEHDKSVPRSTAASQRSGTLPPARRRARLVLAPAFAFHRGARDLAEALAMRPSAMKSRARRCPPPVNSRRGGRSPGGACVDRRGGRDLARSAAGREVARHCSSSAGVASMPAMTLARANGWKRGCASPSGRRARPHQSRAHRIAAGAGGLGELDIVEPMAREALADAKRQRDLRSEHFAHHFLADCPLIRGDAATARRATGARWSSPSSSATARRPRSKSRVSRWRRRRIAPRARCAGRRRGRRVRRLGIDLSGTGSGARCSIAIRPRARRTRRVGGGSRVAGRPATGFRHGCQRSASGADGHHFVRDLGCYFVNPMPGLEVALLRGREAIFEQIFRALTQLTRRARRL